MNLWYSRKMGLFYSFREFNRSRKKIGREDKKRRCFDAVYIRQAWNVAARCTRMTYVIKMLRQFHEMVACTCSQETKSFSKAKLSPCDSSRLLLFNEKSTILTNLHATHDKSIRHLLNHCAFLLHWENNDAILQLLNSISAASQHGKPIVIFNDK